MRRSRRTPLAVDLDDREQLAVTRLELLVAVDVDLLELEAGSACASTNRPRALAEVAARRPVEND